ncbi:MAG: response regulator [Aggregatilineales bacterium]
MTGRKALLNVGKESKVPYNIIVVDDDRHTASYMADMLRMLGHTVITLYTPRSAMRQLNEVVPDVIFVDINLPGIDGLEVCRYLRRDPTTAHVPIIIVSANSETAYREAATAAGADLYMVKPVMLEDLDEALTQVSGGHNSEPGAAT